MRSLHTCWQSMCLVLVFLVTSFAQVPPGTTIQGRLTDDFGSPVPDGPTQMTFTIYGSEFGPDVLWSSGSQFVEVTSGLFTYELGFFSPFPPGLFEVGGERYLGIQVGADPELLPRVRMTTGPFAFKAFSAQLSDTAGLAMTVTPNSVTSAAIVDGAIGLVDLGQNGAANGQVIKWNGSEWEMAADEQGAGSGVGWDWSDSSSHGPDSVGYADFADSADAITDGAINNADVASNAGIALSKIGPFSSSDLAGRLSDETGTGSAVMNSGPTITTPQLQLESAASPSPTLEGKVQWDSDDDRLVVGTGASSATFYSGPHTADGANGWTDGGTTVHLDTDNDSVGIGTSNPSAKLEIIGDLRVVGKAAIGTNVTNTGLRAFVTGYENSASGSYSVVAGGYGNKASRAGAVVGGGRNNYANGDYSVIAGGGGTSVLDSNAALGRSAVIGGGRANVAADGAVVAGGVANKATGGQSTISGGYRNTASATNAMVLGGQDNEASGVSSLAAGRQAKALHTGAFVWADRTVSDFASTAENQFLIRAAGGVGINTNAPLAHLSIEAAAATESGIYIRGSSRDITWAEGQTLQIGTLTGTTFSEKMRILNGGDVGIGTTSISARLEVEAGSGKRAAEFTNDYSSAGTGVSAATVKAENTNASGIALHAKATTSDATAVLSNGGTGLILKCFGVGSSTVFAVKAQSKVGILTSSPNYNLDVRGTIGNNTTTYHSDRRWKSDIRPLRSSLDQVLRLQGVSYLWKRAEFAEMNFPEGRHIGVIAQEVEDVIPEVVNTAPDGYKSVEYSKLVAVLIEAVKEQQTQIASQQSEIDELRSLLESQKARR